MRKDCVIIGAGPSGLAAGIRLAHFGKKVCICEQHSKTGGLNSYYTRRGVVIDSGLHAMTNYAGAKDSKSLPLLKLLRQLRIPHSELHLREQNGSRISFPEAELRFSNEFALLESEVRETFPDQTDRFIKFDNYIRTYDGLDISAGYISARKTVNEFITEPLLAEMLFCPLMYYGSAVEDDMDFAQFVIMYKSIFHEGFCRPAEGIERLLALLETRFRECGGEIIRSCANIADSETPQIALNCGICKIITAGGRVSAVELADGTLIETDTVLSSAGFPETMKMVDKNRIFTSKERRGQLAFVETVALLSNSPADFGCDTTITFFNKSANFAYRNPETLINSRSGVVCIPDNFKFFPKDTPPHNQIRVTMLANHKKWMNLTEESYALEKKKVEYEALKAAAEYSGKRDLAKHVQFTDIFTPKTVMRYTGHFNGAIYGSPDKQKDGKTEIEKLFLCGTDQGFLGITGSMLSGISMANMHILQG